MKKYETDSESIKFEFFFKSDYWDLPPKIDILVDNQIKFSGKIVDDHDHIKFTHDLDFNKSHCIKIKRYNKLPNQCVLLNDGTFKDQLLTLEKVIIDDINIKNIIQAYSYNEPIYPEPWATLQRKQGIVLETRVIAETVFGHNGTWTLNFTSPFYEFVMDWMNGELE